MLFDISRLSAETVQLLQAFSLVLFLVSLASFFDQMIAKAKAAREMQELERRASLLDAGTIGFYDRSGRRAARLGMSVSPTNLEMRTPEQHFVYMRAFRDELKNIKNMPQGE